MNEHKSPVSLENSHIKLAIEEHPGCKVNFSITTLPPATEAAKKASIKAISKEVNIPGFRKGRAPEALLIQKFEPQINRELIDILIKNSLNEAVQLSRIVPVNAKNSMKLVKCEKIDETSYLIVVEFERYPEVPSVEPEKLSILESFPDPVQEEDIQARIDELQLHHAEWEEVLDRSAKEDDFVTLDIDIVNDQTTEKAHENSRFYLKEKKLPRWLKQLVEGLSINESATGVSSPESKEEEPHFQPKTFKVTVKKIEQAKRPPVDEALAKKAGVETVESLKEAIVKSLKNAAEVKAKQMNRKAMKTALLNTYSFELPSSRLQEAHDESHRIASGAAHLEKEQQDVYAHKILDDAKDNIRFSYLLQKIFNSFGLKFPDSQTISQRATEEMIRRYMQGEKDLTSNDLEYFSQVAENELVAETALDFLLEYNKRA